MRTLPTGLLEKLVLEIDGDMHGQGRDLRQEIVSISDSLVEYHTRWICISGMCTLQ